MLKFVLASRNKKKIRELETFLAGIPSDKVILSLDDIGYHGEIVEDGTHAQLVEAGGEYASLWSRQTGAFLEA